MRLVRALLVMLCVTRAGAQCVAGYYNSNPISDSCISDPNWNSKFGECPSYAYEYPDSNYDFCVGDGACDYCCECTNLCWDSSCVQCPANTYSNQDAIACIGCDAGKTSTAGATACVSSGCATGTYVSGGAARTVSLGGILLWCRRSHAPDVRPGRTRA